MLPHVVVQCGPMLYRAGMIDSGAESSCMSLDMYQWLQRYNPDSIKTKPARKVYEERMMNRCKLNALWHFLLQLLAYVFSLISW